jgi:hypothetical protein
LDHDDDDEEEDAEVGAPLETESFDTKYFDSSRLNNLLAKRSNMMANESTFVVTGAPVSLCFLARGRYNMPRTIRMPQRRNDGSLQKAIQSHFSRFQYLKRCNQV